VAVGLFLVALTALPAQTLPSFDLENWDGGAFSTASFEGRTTILTYTFAKCIFACPMITFLLKELDEDLGSPAELRYLHISVNPSEDTGEEILAHFLKHDIDPREDPRWLFLNGPEPGIAQLLREAGIEVRHTEVEGGIVTEHTIQVLVVGPDGSPVAAFDTYYWEEEVMADALRSALESS
jgi:cytochrome oxidase Cu insertion factor (SCO1/SenC/PrrC family)